MSDYYFVQTQLNNNVMDVDELNTAPNTQVISYPQKSSGTDNQLWLRVPTGALDPSSGQSLYYLQSKLNGDVLTVLGGNTAPITPVVNAPRLSPPSNSQIWQIVDSDVDGYFNIVSQLNGYVVDVKDNNTAATTPLINFPLKSPGAPNQRWTFVDSNVPGPKNSAFA